MQNRMEKLKDFKIFFQGRKYAVTPNGFSSEESVFLPQKTRNMSDQQY